MTLFHLQLTLSFIIGGIAIALLSYIAEKVPKRLAGVVLPLPSTVAISYLFIAIVLSPEVIRDIAPATIMATGVIVLFVLAYLYLARLPKKKSHSMLLAGVGSLTLWFLGSIPLALYEFSHLGYALLGYGMCTIIGYVLLTKRVAVVDIPTSNTYTKTALATRALIGGCVISLAVLLSKVVGPFWGGIFSGFPAVFTSTLLILHFYHTPAFLARTFHNIPLGLTVSLVFPLSAAYAFPAFGTLGGFILSYAASVVTAIVIFSATKKQH